MGIRSKIRRIIVKHPRDYGEKIKVNSYGVDDIIADLEEYGRRVKAANLDEQKTISKMELVDGLVDLNDVEFRQVISCARHNRRCLKRYMRAIAEKDKLERK